jgi:alpha/beta hydrolase fold
LKLARRPVRAAILACGLLALAAPAAGAQNGPTPPPLDWQACGTAANVVCADVAVPRDYRRPDRGTITLHLAKSPATDQANRIGPLFINFGGPGGTAADTFEADGADVFPGLNARYDIIAMDPRGVGQSKPSIDCQANQETQGI